MPPLSTEYRFIVRTGRDKLLSYKAMPVAMQAVEGVELILLERKRAIADILTNGRKLDIAKRACAMIIIEGLPDSARDSVRNRLAGLKKPDPEEPLDGAIARTLGTVFEYAKQHKNRGATGRFMGVLPESMTYFIRERVSNDQ